ncbi:MAG: hypothetical protein INH41_26505, partial [Myxococcaceae bacterium]|nr:hypothetical protein [Myxococcaceae bacterium]
MNTVIQGLRAPKWFSLVGVVVLAGCGVKLDGAACVTDDNCPRGQVCVESVCVVGTPIVDGGNVGTDAGTMDAGTMDAGTMDAGTMDAGTMD